MEGQAGEVIPAASGKHKKYRGHFPDYGYFFFPFRCGFCFDKSVSGGDVGGDAYTGTGITVFEEIGEECVVAVRCFDE